MSRPKGKPQYGWTVNGHMIDLRKKKFYNEKDKPKLVTSEGWNDWYPVEPDEFSLKHKCFVDSEDAQEELFQ